MPNRGPIGSISGTGRKSDFEVHVLLRAGSSGLYPSVTFTDPSVDIHVHEILLVNISSKIIIIYIVTSWCLRGRPDSRGEIIMSTEVQVHVQQ